MAGSWEQRWMDEALRSGMRGQMYGRPSRGNDIRCAMCALDPQALPDEAREVFTIIFGYAICEDHFSQIFPGEDEALEMKLRNLLEEQIRTDIHGQLNQAARTQERVRREQAERRMRERLQAAQRPADTPFGQSLLDDVRSGFGGRIRYESESSDVQAEIREEAEAFLKAQEENRRKREGS